MPSLHFSNGLPHLDPTINGHHFHFENSNTTFGLDHNNEGRGGFLSSLQPLTAGNNNINFNSQTGTMSSSSTGRFGLGLGGSGGLGQFGVAMNSSSDELMRRANSVAPPPQSQRIFQVHTVIDYVPAAVIQNSSLGPNHEVMTFTETVRTQLLTATSTRERILLQLSNNNINRASVSVSASGFAWNKNYNNNLQYTQNNILREHQHSILSHDQYPNNQPPAPPRSTRATIRLIENATDSIGSSSIVHAVAVGHEASRDHQTDEDADYSSDDQYYEVGDGRTHSLPCKKYGPYTCPRCRGVFSTSQSFAAHMGSHYKYETASERKRRKEAKYGKKSLRLVHSRDGLTLLPAARSACDAKNNRRKLAKRLHHQDQDPNQLPHHHHAPPTSPPLHYSDDGLVEVKVKDEPFDMLFD